MRKPMATRFDDLERPTPWQNFCAVVFLTICMAPFVYSLMVVLGVV